MRIAIIGAGFAGLAAAWHLSKLFSVVVFDSKGIGAGASGIAAGLMHPFSGAQARLNPYGFEGMAASLNLIREAEAASGKQLSTVKGLLRQAITPFQKDSFAASHRCHQNEIDWWEKEKCLEKMPALAAEPGIYIPSALKIDCQEYLQALWTACEKQGARLEIASIASMHTLGGFEAIIIATGASSALYPEMSQHTVTPVKGQILEIVLPQGVELPFSLSSSAYVAGHPKRRTFYAGATYERGFASSLPDIHSAKKLIIPKLENIAPTLAAEEIIDCQAGVRASTPDHLPIASRLSEKVWALTGFGSKGLLYHALYAQKVSKEIISKGS